MNMVEKIARALCAIDDVNPDDLVPGTLVPRWMGYQVDARAALEALRVPSDEMVKAAAYAMWVADDKALWTDVMSAMITAALGETE